MIMHVANPTTESYMTIHIHNTLGIYL